MSWREQLRPASFRGKPFYVASHNAQAGGRRAVLHQYPGRDKPLAEDLGRRAHVFDIEGYVLGADYMTARDALVDACNAAGAATLVHPYLGSRQVMCQSCRVRESTAEGGIATFSLRFMEAGENRFPTASADTAAAVNRSGEVAAGAIALNLASNFSVNGVPQFVASAAGSIVSSFGGQFEAMALRLNNGRLPASAIRQVTNLVKQAPALLRNPGSFAGSARGMLTGMAFPVAKAAVSELATLSGFDQQLPGVVPTTANRQRQADNQLVLSGFLRQSSLVAAAEIAPTATFTSQADALATRDRLGDLFDGELDSLSQQGADQAFGAMRQLRTDMVRDMTARAPGFGQVVKVAAKVTEPALVSAHRMFGDALKEGEILARNGVRNPNAVQGGEILEVRADA